MPSRRAALSLAITCLVLALVLPLATAAKPTRETIVEPQSLGVACADVRTIPSLAADGVVEWYQHPDC